MLTDQEIQEALHATRVVPLAVPNPHGPLGLEQLAAAVARVLEPPEESSQQIRRPISLSVETWEKLKQLALAQTTSRPVSASQIATAIIEQFVGTSAALD